MIFFVNRMLDRFGIQEFKLAKRMKKEQIIVVNLSGRGDKDLGTVMKELKL